MEGTGSRVQALLFASIRSRISAATSSTSAGARTDSPTSCLRATTSGAKVLAFLLSVDRISTRSRFEAPAAIKSGTRISISCSIVFVAGNERAVRQPERVHGSLAFSMKE